jgi:hypothetical protein
MKTGKTVYYQTRIKEFSLAKDMKKTWSLINTLLGRGGKLSNIAEININGNLYNDRKQIAEHLNDYRIMKICIVIQLMQIQNSIFKQLLKLIF